MRQSNHGRFKLGCLLAGLLAAAWLGNQASQADTTEIAWTEPQATALRRISNVDPRPHEPGLLSNLDCSQLTYRLRDSPSMRSGCFTDTAFGLIDGTDNIVILNGTDEGQTLLPAGIHQAVVPWPPIGGLMVFTVDSIDGGYLGLYRNPTDHLSDEYTGPPVSLAKRLTAPPDLTLQGPDGRPLLVNAQTLAFSENGQWMVVEDLLGSFVRINLDGLGVLPFTRSFFIPGSPGLLQSQVAVSPSGRYVAIANKDAASLKLYDLESCQGHLDGLKPLSCRRYEYQPYIAESIPGFLTARHLRFVNEGLISFEAQDGPSSRAGVYELAPRASITNLIGYLALGDSYTSGEGAFDYLAGTDTADNHCHLSVYAYPSRLAQDRFGTGSAHNVACSGAVINDVGSLSRDYRGQARGADSWERLQSEPDKLNAIMAGFLPGYLAQIRFAQNYQPSLATVSVGGNDIGFGDIIQACVTPHLSLRSAANTCYASYEDRLEVTQQIDRTVPHLVSLYGRLKQVSPASQYYVVGYPQIIVANGSCGLNVHLDLAERQFAVELVEYLNAAISQAARAAGVSFIDISQALSGHRLCETGSHDTAVNGLTAGTDAGPVIKIFGKESYHPNALGYRLIEHSVLAKLGDTAADSGGNPPLPTPPTLLNAPVTGRTVNHVVPDDSMAPDTLVRNQTVRVQIDGLQHGLAPHSLFEIRLGATVLGSAQTDATSSLTAEVTLPPSTPLGFSDLEAAGRDVSGGPVIIHRPVFVLATLEDSETFDLLSLAGTSGRPFMTSLPYSRAAQSILRNPVTYPKSRQAGRHRHRPPFIIKWRWLLASFLFIWLTILIIIAGVKSWRFRLQ